MSDDKNTEEIEGNAEEKESKEALRQVVLIVENSADAIIGTTLKGIITSWNSGATKIFGYTAKEMIGKSDTVLIPTNLKEEGLYLLNRIKNRETIKNFESERIQKDGTKIDVSFSLSPVLSPDGSIIGLSTVLHNHSEEKKSIEYLLQIELFVENSHDAIIGETLDGVITSWNGGAQKMLGYTKEEAIGKSAAFLLPPERQPDIATLMEKIKEHEFIASYDSVRIRKDGSIINVSLSISPITQEDGTVIGASLVERDISEQKKNEQHIKEMNDVRNKFIEIISHQLRTPLTAVNWNLETLLNGDFGKLEDTQQKFLEVTHHASMEITRRIHNLLTAMDIEEGHINYKTSKIALNSICEGVKQEMINKCELKNISCLYTHSVQEPPAIETDAEKIRLVVTAFIENAIAYTKDNGTVTIKLSTNGDFARFEVIDTGIGIPEAEQNRVFSRFFRASNASTMQPDANGLGLFIAKNFIEEQGGTIGFESTEGKGSTFWFEIPIRHQGDKA